MDDQRWRGKTGGRIQLLGDSESTPLAILCVFANELLIFITALANIRDFANGRLIKPKREANQYDFASRLPLYIQGLLVECLSNVNGASYCAAYHRVVTDSEETHHLNVCRN